MNNLNVNLDAAGTKPVFGNKRIITSLKQAPVIIQPGKNRQRLEQTVDRFIKTLVRPQEQGDIPTLERLEDADTALNIANKLQDIAKKLFERAQQGIQDVKDRPFNEEHPKMTLLEEGIVNTGELVNNKINATMPLVIPVDDGVMDLIKNTKDDLLKKQTKKIDDLKEKLAKAIGENSRLKNTHEKIREHFPEAGIQGIEI